MGAKRPKNSFKTTPGATASPVVVVSRSIKDLTRLLLFVRAGGRCEFDGCNDYLLQHPLTLTPGNFAQMAHSSPSRKTVRAAMRRSAPPISTM